MRILLTGANGFIGSQIYSALVDAGHEVIPAVRSVTNNDKAIACDFSRDIHVDDWLPRLEGVDAVVNCAGILREQGANNFHNVHIATPRALFQACVQAGVKRVIQISALGTDKDGEFIASKHRGDAELMHLDIDWFVLRPSVVYSPRGSYGGTSLLRAMAALPGILCVPGSGVQQLQPIDGDSLGRAVVALLDDAVPARQVIEAVGADVVTLSDYLLAWRRWLGFSSPLKIHVPLIFVYWVSLLGEWFGRGPLNLTMYRMLQHGNIGQPGALDHFERTLGFKPPNIHGCLSRHVCFVQDRWHARLYLVEPILRFALAFMWIMSGVVGFVLPIEQSQAVLSAAGLAEGAVLPLVYFASSVDCALGVMLLLAWRINLVGGLMILSLLAYTLFIGIWLPAYWLEPFGGLIKNIPLIPAVLVMMVLSNRR